MMKLMTRTGLAITALTLFTTACTHTPQEAPEPTETPAVAETADTLEEAPEPITMPETPLTAREHTRRAIELLSEGEEELATIELNAMLLMDPQNRIGLKLLNQIKADPKEILGESHMPYTVQAGETTSSLAKAYLGDALLFYALSRYNDLEAPDRLMAGQTLKMPNGFSELAGAPGNAGEIAPDMDPAEEKPVEMAEEPAQPAPVEMASATDVEAANALRLQALEQLNAGHSDRAVTLLQQARKLDSNNPRIKADLAKVERIQAALNNSN